MSLWKVSSYRTVCEVLREVNDLYQGTGVTDEGVRYHLAEAERRCKWLSKALRLHSKKAQAEFWEVNRDLEAKIVRAEETYICRRACRSQMKGDRPVWAVLDDISGVVAGDPDPVRASRVKDLLAEAGRMVQRMESKLREYEGGVA